MEKLADFIINEQVAIVEKSQDCFSSNNLQKGVTTQL